MNITAKSAWRLALAKIGDLLTTTLSAATLKVETNSFQTASVVSQAPRSLLFTLSNQKQPSGEITTPHTL
jgi:hypothetical protein